MAKENKDNKGAGEEQARVEIKQPKIKESPFNLQEKVKVKLTETAPHHGPSPKGKVVEMSPIVAEKAIANGWAEKIGMIAFLALALIFSACFSFEAKAQKAMYNDLGPTTLFSDTATNTGTATITALWKAASSTVTVQARFERLSGTAGGTATLQGSLDGTNWATASATTYTVTNTADQSTGWVITGSPWLYYRVSYTGTGTMAVRLYGKLYGH